MTLIKERFAIKVKWMWILITFFLLQSGLMMHGQSSGEPAKRNLTIYDKAGPYTIAYEPPYKADKYLGEIRDFLWEHWKGQRLGVVKATFYTLEGDSSFSSSYVEPDKKGCWWIRVESESTISALLPKGRKPRREITQEEYDEIERVEPGQAGSLIPIPRDELRYPQKYQLRLRNSRKNLVRIF